MHDPLDGAARGGGFHLRGAGSGNLPYKTMYIALPETADVRIWMQRYINATGQTKIVDNPNDAEAAKFKDYFEWSEPLAKAPSRTTALASRFSSSDSGSMFELPTVAQSSSTIATLACRKAGVYS